MHLDEYLGIEGSGTYEKREAIKLSKQSSAMPSMTAREALNAVSPQDVDYMIAASKRRTTGLGGGVQLLGGYEETLG